MANVICHQATEQPVKAGDLVATPKGPRKVLLTNYGARQGARVWVRNPARVGDREVYAASECGCYVTSRD